MTEVSAYLIGLIVLAIVLVLFYVYITSVEKAFLAMGLTQGEVGAIILVTLFLGYVPIPLFPYHGWWVGISIGGGVIPLILCAFFLKSRRVDPAEVVIGTIIVTYITYFVTRAEEGVGIVADLPLALAPALGAGLFSLSTFWIDIRRAAPLAYVTGILGTLLGADVLHLGEILSFAAPSEGTPMLVIGGGNIFDMVFITGVVSVFIAMFVLWLKRQQRKRGYGAVFYEFEHGPENLPYAKDAEPAPTLFKKPAKRI